ncbi:MXAN_6230/SCO0854 family RING domain-containing protein [Actinoplanes sp. CA-054009]
MDALASVVLRRAGLVAVDGSGPADAAWVAALEADLAARGRLLRADLRAAAARLPVETRVRWADWLLATVDSDTGADRPMVPLHRAFPDTPVDIEAEFVSKLLTHLFAARFAPCVVCGREEGGQPLDPCGHVVCPACFPPSLYSACPICGRRLSGDDVYLSVVAPAPAVPGVPVMPMRLIGLAPSVEDTAAELRDTLVARPGALSEEDREDLRVLVAATAPGTLDWLPATVPARETLALVIAWALHATALTPAYPAVIAEARRRWGTATDVARTLWAYSGGDPGLILPRRRPEPVSPWRPGDEPRVVKPVARVRALPRQLRRAALGHLDSRGAPAAAEDMRRHPAVWKRLGERLHPYEKVTAHPAAAVAFAALRGTRAPREDELGTAIVAACEASPRHLALVTHDDGTVSAHLRTHPALVEDALAEGDVAAAASLLTERPGELWRRADHLLRLAGDDPGPVTGALAATAARVAPGVLAAAAAALAHRDATVAATGAQLAATARARAAARAHAPVTVATDPASIAFPNHVLRDALRVAARRLGTRSIPTAGARADGPPDPSADASSADVSAAGVSAAGVSADRVSLDDVSSDEENGIVGGRPGPGMPRRVFFPRGDTVKTWTEPERRRTLSVAAIDAVRGIADAELTRRAGRHERFDLAVLDAALARVPAPMRERAASAQLAGWPRGSVRDLPGDGVLRLFLHWQDAGEHRVDLDLSCVFFDERWRRVGYCDYTQLRFAGEAAIHSGDLTSAPAPLGATEFLDLDVARLAGRRVRYAVPIVFSYNEVPFENLTEAFAGLMRPEAEGAQFDAARVVQRFDLRGDARMLMPMVLDLTGGSLLWTDLSLPGTGYGHSVARHRDQLARAAADQWEHFGAGNRATVLDVLGWHAAARADRVLIAHADGTYSEVPASLPAIREAAAAASGSPVRPPAGTVLAGAVDVAALDRFVPAPTAGSVAVTVSGEPAEPWSARHIGDLLGELVP